ncbi:glycosyl transferase family 2 [Fervidicella metallireducens AeB]|uniref:Glucosyl-3-phosphoglycerate synthase n=1 Tax=Fervidicella metallireducens AeB TaxID=1403537 RepID=A0A017RZH4_9CLOT|nr:glycosyltransferase family 2 protein [Fervidicella metallireducens]EYE89345.1 glycosyl transferase family 2 [Fervidicella metallireducens AeB]
MKVACIIPAYNEERTIKEIIDVVKQVDLIDEIIVVSDGSKDQTVSISKKAGAKVIENKINKGKGAALKIGIDSSDSDIFTFLDADLVGLKKEHVIDLLMPVLNDEADMSVGIFKSGRIATNLAQKVAPNLSGQRTIKRQLIEEIENIDITRYGVEIALTKIAQKRNYRTKNVFLDNLTHVMKEEKLGLRKGFKARLKMYWEIAKCLKME